MVQYIYTLGADLISQERNGRTYTYLYDGHGSVVGLMSESGSVTDTYTYDAFGNLLKSTGRTENNYRYCGEQFDSTTGLYYLRARYMDTNTGRFISQDSYAGSVYDPVSLHKYLYANSNPVTYSDPSGYMGLADTMTSCAIIGSLSGGMINVGMNILRSLLGDQSMAARYSSPITAIINDFLDGMVLGMMAGIIVASFLTLLPQYALVVAFNMFYAMNYYTLAQESIRSGQWVAALYYSYFCVFSIVCAFSAMKTAEYYQNLIEDNAKTNEQNLNNNKLPLDNSSQMGHIFRDDEGHIPDTPQNRELLLSCGTNEAYYNGTDSRGNDWYIRPISENEYVWVESRNGTIWDGGVSNRPLNWSDETGYKIPKSPRK